MIASFTTFATIVVLATAPADEQSFYYATSLDLRTDALAAGAPAEVVDENRGELERGILDLLRKHRIELATDASDAARLTVELAWVNAKKSIYDVQIRCDRPDGGTHSLSFEMLGDHFDVLARIEKDLPTILGWLERPDTTEAPPAPSTKTAPHDADPPVADAPDQRKVGPLGWTGVGLMAAGLGPLIAGAVLYPQTESRLVQVDTGSGFESRTETERKYPLALTATLMGVGAAVVVTGVGLLAGDVVRRRNKRSSTFSPIVSPSLVGFTVTRSF